MFESILGAAVRLVRRIGSEYLREDSPGSEPSSVKRISVPGADRRTKWRSFVKNPAGCENSGEGTWAAAREISDRK